MGHISYVLAWRDFYTHVLAAFPHVSMGRPFQEKYADIKWEVDQAKFEAWKDGMTGYPIVDAVRHYSPSCLTRNLGIHT